MDRQPRGESAAPPPMQSETANDHAIGQDFQSGKGCVACAHKLNGGEYAFAVQMVRDLKNTSLKSHIRRVDVQIERAGLDHDLRNDGFL